jgi:caa(3)-type oxidase subunit IV
MTDTHDMHPYPGPVTVWVYLLILLVLGVAAAYLPASRDLVLTLIFGVALVKATLVARHYMHLRAEHALIYAIAAIPLLLCLAFAVSLVPDLIWSRGTSGAP